MYSGQGYYYPPPSSIHDEASLTYAHNQHIYHPASYQQQPQDPRYPIYRNPSSAPVAPPASTPYYPSQPYYAAPPVPHPSQFTRTPRYDPDPIPQHYMDDPAFSDDPRVNPHFTMNDMEEITPNESSYPDYPYASNQPYPSRDPSYAASTRELQASHGPIYGPVVIPEKLSQAHSSRSQHRDYESSVHTHSSHARLAEGLGRSREDVRLPYDDSAPASKSSYSVASQAVKSYSGSSTSFALANGMAPSPYDIYVPRPPSSSSSSSSDHSSPPPRTPPGPSSVLSSQKKGSTSSLPQSTFTIANPDVPAAVTEAPPAYTPLPTPIESTFTPAAVPPTVNSASGVSAPNVPAIPAASAPDQVVNAYPFPTQSQENLALDSNGVAPSSLAAEQPSASIPPGVAPEPIRIQKSRSRKTSASAPKDLDKIDELDETDPLGYAWHHESPYEAIRKAVDSGLVPGDGADHKRGKPKIFETGLSGPVGNHSQSSSHRNPVAVDPNLTKFKVKPGQVFPSIIATAHARLGHHQVVGPSSETTSSQQPAPKMYTNAHMQPGDHHQPRPKPASSPSEATDERAASQRPPVQTTSSHSSSGSGRQENRSGSESSHRTKLSRHSPPSAYEAPKTPKTPNHPPLQHQASNVSLARSVSAPAARPQVLSTETLPRPDIRLPPPSTTGSHQTTGPPRPPHYLPKRLVMPAPLQQQQLQPPPQTAPPNSSGWGGEQGEADARRREREYLRDRRENENRAPKGAALKHSTSAPSRAPRAQDVPVASGRHLLRKHKSREGAYVEPELEEKKEKKERGGVHIGGITIIPASGRSSSGNAKHGAKGWEMEQGREKEKEKEKERGKKLSKRR